jgi:hypothetical protein
LKTFDQQLGDEEDGDGDGTAQRQGGAVASVRASAYVVFATKCP